MQNISALPKKQVTGRHCESRSWAAFAQSEKFVLRSITGHYCSERKGSHTHTGFLHTIKYATQKCLLNFPKTADSHLNCLQHLQSIFRKYPTLFNKRKCTSPVQTSNLKRENAFQISIKEHRCQKLLLSKIFKIHTVVYS